MQNNKYNKIFKKFDGFNCTATLRGLLTLVVIFMLQLNIASATLDPNRPATTSQGTMLTINLSSSITNITTPVVMVSSAPSHGTAIAIPCGDGTDRCIEYTPDANYNGIDVFQYSVVNDQLDTETATITVQVGDVTSLGTSGLLASQEIKKTIVSFCASVIIDSPADANICAPYRGIDPSTPQGKEDLRILLDALSPAEVAAQATVSSVLASEQLANIGKHLAALRKGQQLTSVAGLKFQHDEKTIDGGMLAGSIDGASRGGGASADTGHSRWDVFINGNIGGGKQDESEFENGFKFKSNGISAGADYRFGSTGVLGGAVGFAATNLDLDYDQGGLDARGLSFIGYGSLYPTDNSYIDIIVSINSASFDSQRRIVFGATDDFTLGSNDSSTLATHLATGYNLVQSGGFSASLDAIADYAQTKIDGYSETGDSAFNVTVADHEVSQLTASLGTTMTYAISSARAVFIPQLDLFWVHQFKEEADIIEGYFNVDPNQTIFRFNSNLPDANFFKVELGMSAISTAGTTSFIQLGSTVSRSDYQNWHLAIGLRMEL